MQINSEQTTNTRNVGSARSRRMLSPPVDWLAPVSVAGPAAFGGVCGKYRQKMDRTADRTAATKNWWLVTPPMTKPINQPDTIQPHVPHTRIPGKSRFESAIFAKLIEFVRARVGM